jgi:hypothetical protein
MKKYENKGIKSIMKDGVTKEVEWDSTYDGEKGKISINVNNNGEKKRVDYLLNDEESFAKSLMNLENILNVPTVDIPLEKRLKELHNNPKNGMKQIALNPNKSLTTRIEYLD